MMNRVPARCPLPDAARSGSGRRGWQSGVAPRSCSPGDWPSSCTARGSTAPPFGPCRHDANRDPTSFSLRRRRAPVRTLAEHQALDTAMPEPRAVRGRHVGDGLPLSTPIASSGCRHLRPITANSAHPPRAQPEPRSDTPEDRGCPDLKSSLPSRGSAVVRIARSGANGRSSGGGWARAPATGSMSGAADDCR